MEYNRTMYEVINLVSRESLLDMVRVLEKMLGIKAKLAFFPPQPGDVPQTWADVEKAKQLLGYETRMDFNEGIRYFAEWIKRSKYIVSNIVGY